MYFVRGVHGEHCQEIFQFGQQFTVIFGDGRKMGLGLRYMTNVCVWVRVAAEREPSPSEAAVDSQSVETATIISGDGRKTALG